MNKRSLILILSFLLLLAAFGVAPAFAASTATTDP